MSLTVGQVSGIIAAAVAVVQLVFPNAIALVIVGILGKEHNAVTWSVAQRSLLSSIWPWLLRADSASGRSVNIGVWLLSSLERLGRLLIAVAAIVTPLGLHEAIVRSNDNVAVPFTDLLDTSPIGIGTPARTNDGFTRACGNFAPIACPGSDSQVEYIYGDPLEPDTITDSELTGPYDMMVPSSLIDLYQSGLSTQPETVSSFFDIQSRQYTYKNESTKMNNKPYLVDTFRMLEPLVLNDAIEAREGVVVDTQQGRIAFRHHRLPTRSGVGAEWSEDLLFLEPQTECVDTNLTLEFRIPTEGSLSPPLDNLTLIDNGGFSELIQEYPTFNITNSQSEPSLRFRAYKAAWMMNTYSMLIMNVTRPNPDAFAYLKSERGKRFPLTGGLGSTGSANSIIVDTLFSSLVDPDSETKSNSTSMFTNETTTSGTYDNPFNISGANYTDIKILCEGAGGRDFANSSNIFVKCGLVFGAARRADGADTLIFRPGDVYQQSVYSCASTTKATIKTVDFHYNATQGANLEALTIPRITEKEYTDEAGANPAPLWGIETLATWGLAEIQQLWGLISEENKDAPNMTAIRAPQLYLPGYTLLSGPSYGLPGYEYIPGSSAVAATLAGMYAFGTGLGGTGYDYSGATNLALFQKWQGLSVNGTGIAKIMNIVWTDIAANYFTGTRGWGTGNNTVDATGKLRKRQSSGGGDDETVMVPVRLYERKIRYHWAYGIPAFIVAAIFLCTLFSSLCCMAFRGGPKVSSLIYNIAQSQKLTSPTANKILLESPERWASAWRAKISRRHRQAGRHHSVDQGGGQASCCAQRWLWLWSRCACQRSSHTIDSCQSLSRTAGLFWQRGQAGLPSAC
jgi:hypothetical protein